MRSDDLVLIGGALMALKVAPLLNIAILLTNGLAWAQGLNWGAAITGITVIGGLLVGLVGKWFTTRAAGILEVKKAEAEGNAAVAKAEAEANAYRERLEMKVQSEWDEVNAHTLKGQMEKLQQAVEADRERTEDANKKLHEIRNSFNDATVQHRLQRETLIAEVAALTESLEAARREIAEFHRRENAKLNIMATGQARQDAAIDQNAADIERIKQGSSGEIEVPKINP